MMAIGGYMALTFADGITTDAFYSELLESHPLDKVEQLRGHRGLGLRGETGGVFPRKRWLRDVSSALASLRSRVGFFQGSNAWVLSGRRTVSGLPILANDPHIDFGIPGTWYEAHLISARHEIYGHFIAGIPFPIIGHNRDKAWALTMAQIDDMDLYAETFHPQEPDLVMYRGRWVGVKKYREKIKVKGGQDVGVDIVVTPHGPLIDSTKHAVRDKHVSLKWSYYHPENDALGAFYKLARAGGVEEMKEALAYAAAPPMSVTWIDSGGHIAWKVLGKLPLRQGFHGGQILDGTSGRHEYARYLSAQENPGRDDPAEGLIVTANYHHPEYDGPLALGGYWHPSERFERIHRLLAKKDKWSLKELKEIQTDRHVPVFDRVVPILLQAMDGQEEALGTRGRRILRKIGDWRGGSGVESTASSIYHMWKYWVAREALWDELGERHYREFHKTSDSQHFFKRLIADEGSLWWDDVGTGEVRESRRDIIRRAFQKAVARLDE